MRLDLSLIEKMENFVRSGDLKSVKNILQDISVRNVPRSFAFKIANLSRRVGHHRFALRLLNPIIHPTKSLQIPVTDEEVIEYAVNLMRIGIVGEALRLLENIKSKKNPDVLLYKAFCWVTLWEHEKAVPMILEYLKSNQISDYQKLVAKMNLGAYFVNLFQFAKAEEIIKDVLKRFQIHEHKLLAGYAYQTLAEISIHKRQFEKAKQLIEESENLFQSEHYRYAVYNKQLLAMCLLLNKNPDMKYVLAVKKEAKQRKLWEVCRDLELYEAIIRKNKNKLVELKFGTPFVKFRERIDKLNVKKIVLPKSFTWYPNGRPDKNNHIFDVASGTDLRSGSELNKGQLLHRLLETFSSDFYRPFKIEALFSKLFPDEFYQPTHSLPKVAALIVRLRKWFREKRIPLEILNVSRNEFQLAAAKPYGIRVKIFEKQKSRDEFFLETLKQKFESDWFSCQLAVTETGFSRATCKRYIRTALDNKVLVSEGYAQYTKYRFKP